MEPLSIFIDTSQMERFAAGMKNFPARLQKRLLTAMKQSQTDLLKAMWESPIPVVSGTLHRSWNVMTPIPAATGLGWSGGVSSDLHYAMYIEFGFHGNQLVRAHTRHMAFGRPTKPFTCGPFTRNVDFAGRPYIRPAIPRAVPMIQKRHTDAVQAAFKSAWEAGPE